MTQKFLSDGTVVPVTAIEAGPCTVTQVKGEKDGYMAVQVGFGVKRSLNKPLAGHLKTLGNFRYLREFPVEKVDDFARGKMFDVSSFKVGDKVQVIAVSKGKGFQGVVKRHHFHGSPKSHGHKDQLRMPGSIGAQEPQHVFKGKRMAGRMGGDQVTVKNLEIVDIDLEKNILYIKGAIPGAHNNLVEISGSGDLIFVEKVQALATEASIETEAAPATPETVEAPAEEIKAEEKEEAKDLPEKVEN